MVFPPLLTTLHLYSSPSPAAPSCTTDQEAHSLALRTLPESIAGRVLAAYLGMVSESLLRALGAAPAINMFGMLRLLSDVGGLRAVVERAGADPEPLAPVCLFAEALVFGRLGPQGVPGIQAPRLLQLLERYREVPRSSGLAGQHSTPSAGKGSPEVRWGVCGVWEGKVEGGPVCACWTAPWPAAGALVRLPDAAPPS